VLTLLRLLLMPLVQLAAEKGFKRYTVYLLYQYESTNTDS
jgi:hypothetical protein